MKKILVLDDDSQILKMIKIMLKQASYSVECAANGKNAIKRIARGDIDILITDILMPEMDGIELINQLKKQGYNIPIIAMSGGRRKLSAEFNLKSATMLGADNVLEKPFTQQQLLRAVEDCILI